MELKSIVEKLVARSPLRFRSSGGSEIFIVLKYRTLHGDFYYFRFDHRNETKHWADERTLGNRASFNFNGNGDISIFTLRSVKESDQGIYRCRVDFKSSPTRNYNVNLTIISKFNFFFLASPTEYLTCNFYSYVEIAFEKYFPLVRKKSSRARFNQSIFFRHPVRVFSTILRTVLKSACLALY